MTYKLTCPRCDRCTSAVFRAYADGRPCPYCSAPLGDAKTAAQYYRQLPDDHQGVTVDVAALGETEPVRTYTDTFDRGALGPTWQPVPFRTAAEGPFKRGAAKTPEAALAAYDALVDKTRVTDAQQAALDAIRIMAECRHAAELLDEEMRIRAELVVELAPKLAIEHHRRNTHPVDQPCQIDWERLAEVAVDSFAEYYSERQAGRRR
ncbi:hypothetical protein A5717_26295 [Mycolicibacterium porcinum]|uniref:hypothetical protein n=1 Tax=Mycolicibacterium porcinum TaxID=39693 RepID=UPI00080BE476|nr:hypothetical protein [Mycolicibacterium porcinum]OCB09285.1 hypothetical protein A5717_26295 [Mycolicibacterium porcinum]